MLPHCVAWSPSWHLFTLSSLFNHSALLQVWGNYKHRKRAFFSRGSIWPVLPLKRSRRWWCGGGWVFAIDIILLTAHQLMFVALLYHARHLKKESTCHLCLEQRQLWKRSQRRWRLIKLNLFIWLSALGAVIVSALLHLWATQQRQLCDSWRKSCSNSCGCSEWTYFLHRMLNIYCNGLMSSVTLDEVKYYRTPRRKYWRPVPQLGENSWEERRIKWAKSSYSTKNWIIYQNGKNWTLVSSHVKTKH